MSERIIRVAILHLGKCHVGGHNERHHHVIHRHCTIEHPATIEGQGFWTNKQRWVDRKEGLRVANAANQIKHKHDPQGLLFSEDLW